MQRAQSLRLWCCIAFGSSILALVDPAVAAKDSAAYVKDAEQYFTNGNLRGAEIELRNAVREAPSDSSIRARLADVYLQLGNFTSAEREARAAGDLGAEEKDYLPTLADALLRQQQFGRLLDAIQPGDRDPILESKLRMALGVAAAALRDWDRAEDMLRDAVRLDPSTEKPKLQLAQLLNQQHPDEADKLIDAVIAASPRSTEPLQVKGEMLRARGDRGGAERLFDHVLQLDPDYARARLSRAEINIEQDKFTAADKDLDPILKSDPNHFIANYLRGVEFAKQQRYAEADRICDRISSGFAAFPAGYYLQGATKLALGQFSKAEIILASYLERVPGDARAVRLIARAALQQHGAPRAIDYLKPLADKSPGDTAILTALGDAYMANGKPGLALQQFEKAAVLDPEDPTIKTGVAVSAIDAGQSQVGLLQLQQVFDHDEAGAVIAGPTLVLSELRAGHVDKAGEVAASLIKKDARNPLYQRLLGAVRVAQQDYKGAETAYHAALARDPEFAGAARELAQLYFATGRADEARKVYNDLLAKKPNDVTGLLGLADIAIAEAKWSEATDIINRARSIARNDPAPGLKLVSVYEMRRDWGSAKAVAGELSTRFPRDVDVVEAQARTQIEAGDTDGAISSYKLAHQLAPNSAPILSRYVALLNEAKYYRDARNVLRDAVAADPRNASWKTDLIRAEAEVGGVDAALAEARRFAKDDPDDTRYQLISAELYEKAGRDAYASRFLEEAVAAHPSDNGLVIAFSRVLGRTGDFGKAETVLTTRLAADPKNDAIKAALAPIYMMTGRPNMAREAYRDLLTQRPNDVAALIALANLEIAERKWPEAQDYIARARAAAPNDPTPGLTLANLYALRQDWKSAITVMAELGEKFPANFDVLDTKARVELESGDTQGAVVTYKRAHELAPSSPLALSRYLAALKAAKNFRSARTVLQAALERDPRNAFVKGEMIRVEGEIGGLDEGLERARSFAASDPDNSLYELLSAELYEKAGRAKEAIALLEKAIVAHPADGGLTIALSGVYQRTGDLAKAEAVLSDRLAAEPKDHAVRAALSSFYLQQKRYDAAVPELTHLIADRPSDPTPLNNLAWLYQQQGDLSKAREMAERAFTIAPRAASIDDTLGWILLAQGEPDQAITYLSAANLSAPRNPNIQYHLAVALHRVGRPTEAAAMLEALLGSGAPFTDKADAERLLQELKRG